jgi:hypothetical protein
LPTLGVYADHFDEDLDDAAANFDAAIRSAGAPLRPQASEAVGPANGQNERELG